MTRTIRRIAATAAALSLVAAGTVAGATAAQAGQLDGDAPVGPTVVVVEPMDAQPIVASHEGDVLLRVSLAMPAEVAAPATARKASAAKKASVKRACAKAFHAARR